MAPKVFLVTGTSTGFGKELVKVVLEKGDIAVATARKPESSINEAFKAAVDKFGRVDVVVNNAGYGLSGEFESLSETQIRTQMEINFFSLLNVTRKAMETMRDLKTGGVIQQITSIGGQVGFPTFSIYCASKFAVEGFTESLAMEMKPESMEFAAEKNPAYDHIDAKRQMEEADFSQAADPRKAVLAWYELAMEEDPPLRCAVGVDAYEKMIEKIEGYGANVKKYEKLSNSTALDG